MEKQIPGASKYLASDEGKIYRINKQNEKIELKGTPDRDGYLRCRICLDSGLWKTCSVHSLVCLTFHGPKPFPKYEVRHLDSNNINNHASNLSWGSKISNEADKIKAGTKLLGETTAGAKLNESAILKIRYMKANGSAVAEIAASVGVTKSTVNRVLRGELWGHVKSNMLLVRRCFYCKNPLPKNSLKNMFCNDACAVELALRLTSQWRWCIRHGWEATSCGEDV